MKNIKETELNVLIPSFFNKKINLLQDENDIYFEVEIEYIGTDKKFNLNKLKDSLDIILSYVDIYKNFLNELTFLLYNKSFSWYQFLTSAQSLDVYKYSSLNRFDCHLITEKTDGERVLIFIHNNTIYFLFSKKKLQKKISIDNIGISIILEGESINYNNKEIILIYDVLFIEKNIKDLTYEERINHFSKCKLYTDNISTSYKIFYKEFGKINNSKDGISKNHDIKSLVDKFYVNNKSGHEIDGLIFSTTSKSYENTINYKWKPAEKSSIDFYASKTNNMYKYNLYVSIPYNYQYILNIDKRDILYNIGNKLHILFKPSYNVNDYTFETKNKDLDGKIIELVKIKSSNYMQWELLKIRNDKVFANSMITAEQVYINYYNPLTIKKLCDGVDGYFKDETNEEFNKSKDWNNKVKFILYKVLFNKFTLLDLASGRGSDIHKYIINNITNVIMVENDEIALQESISDRKYSHLKNFKNNNKKFPTLYAVNADLTNDFDINTQLIIKNTNITKVNAVLISLAIHYFTYTSSLLTNLYKLIENFLVSEGIIIITLLNGKKVFELLKSNNGIWKVPNKYHIEFVNNIKYSSFSQGIEIKVKHPFAGDKLISENLIDINDIIKKFTKQKKYELLQNYLKILYRF